MAPDQHGSHGRPRRFPLWHAPLLAAGVWTGLFWTVALLTSLLAGGLQRALQQSREQAQELRELSNHLEARVAAQTAELAQRAAKAEALYEVSQALTSTLDLDQILDLITEQAARLLGFDSAHVMLQGADGRFTLLGAFPHAALNGDAGTGQRTGAAALAPLVQEMAASRQPRVISLPQDAWSAAQPECAWRPGLGSAALMLPMHYGDRVAGVLMLTNASGRADCGSDDLILGQGLADQAAVAIANAQLLQEAREAATLEERTRLARDIHDTLAQGLTGVVVQLGATQRALAMAPDEALEHLAWPCAWRASRWQRPGARCGTCGAGRSERGDLADALQALACDRLARTWRSPSSEQGEPVAAFLRRGVDAAACVPGSADQRGQACPRQLRPGCC